jgi:hypothetical protein
MRNQQLKPVRRRARVHKMSLREDRDGARAYLNECGRPSIQEHLDRAGASVRRRDGRGAKA